MDTLREYRGVFLDPKAIKEAPRKERRMMVRAGETGLEPKGRHTCGGDVYGTSSYLECAKCGAWSSERLPGRRRLKLASRYN